MPGLVPGIHGSARMQWIAGTSPAMTGELNAISAKGQATP
jgi:hypothetical protein